MLQGVPPWKWGSSLKSGYAAFVLVIGGFATYELELWTICKINK
jgi:hypothetical protein